MKLDERYDAAYKKEKELYKLTNSGFPHNRYEAAVYMIRQLQEANKRDTGGGVLDVGCGNGVLLYNLADYFDSLSGIEFSGRRAARTAQKLPEAVIYQGDFNSYNFERRFDVIVATDVIEHIPDIFGFFIKANKCLDIGGYLILSTPNIMYLRYRLKFLFGIFPGTSGSDEGMGVAEGGLYDGGHLHYFSFSVMRKMAKKYGFEVVCELGCGRYGRLHNLHPSITSGCIGMTLRKITDIKEE